MQFFSTSGQSPASTFQQVLFKGLAPDGGLYMPQYIPQLDTAIFQSTATYTELATSMIAPYVESEIPIPILNDISEKAFDFPLPLKQIEDQLYILELFHGPTLAFKDFAARFMAQTMQYFLRHQDKDLTILVATSGDTGSAVANGFFKAEGIRVIILYPSGKVSKIQEQQLTTLGENVTALEVNGSFDDCQKMVKSAFMDDELRQQRALSSANSINMARLLPQMVYYAWACQKLPAEKVVFSVPSGNFGNITGGLLANGMGLPVEKFVAATNANDIFPTYLEIAEYNPQPAKQTISNAMDVGSPSNLDRIRELYGDDVVAIRKDICSWSFSDEHTREKIQKSVSEWNYFPDPHTAVGILGIEAYFKNTNSKASGVVLATAHPGKFADVVTPIIGKEIILPPQLQETMTLKKVSHIIENDYTSLKEFLMETR